MTPEEIKALNSRNVISTSEGLGDTVAKVAHFVGADKAAELFTRLTGKDCRCKQRQKFLNEVFPYTKGE